MNRNINEDLEAKLLIESDYTCNICRKSKNNVQIHHIKPIEKGGNNLENNLIVLCLNCHSEVHTNRKMAKNYTQKALKSYKQDWINTVKEKKSISYNDIEVMSIYEAMNYALNSLSHINQLSIFAITTSKSVAFFRSKPDLKIDKIDLLLRDYVENDIYYNGELVNQINTSIARWTKYHQDGNIKELNIHRYKFHPNNNFFLFDNSILIIGNIHLKEDYLVESDTDVIVVNNTTELGKKIIQVYQKKFERLLQLEKL